MAGSCYNQLKQTTVQLNPLEKIKIPYLRAPKFVRKNPMTNLSKDKRRLLLKLTTNVPLWLHLVVVYAIIISLYPSNLVIKDLINGSKHVIPACGRDSI